MDNDIERQNAFLTSALELANSTIRAKMDELSLVRRVGDAVSQHTSAWALSSELVNAIAETVNCQYALIYSHLDSVTLELQAISSVIAATDHFPKLIRRNRMVRCLDQDHRPIQIDDIQACPEWTGDWPFPPALRSWLCVPLLARNDMRGVLCLADDAPRAFDERTLRTLMVVVPQISSAFANIGLYKHLRESEIKYRSLVEGMRDVVYICDRKWQILEANPAAEELFGEPIVGKKLTGLFKSAEAAGQFVHSVLSGSVVQNFETELKTARQKDIVTLLSCVTDAGGYSGIIKDMTERTHLLQQVIRAQKMESIGTLASGVAHDFNNILGIILPNAELIKLRIEPGSPANKFADVIVNAAKRAAQLTKQLLSLSRKDPVDLRVINVNESIRTTGKLLGETVDRRIRLEFDLSPGMAKIKADETQIEQVLLNLAINARDAMPDGGVIRFSTQVAEDIVEIRVSDTGTGIESSILPKIFDPFFTTKDKSNGTGLGLSVVYGIVKHCGGTIDVTSEPGLGTEFIIKLPASDGLKRQHTVQYARTAGGSEKILIVDDESEILSLLETTMRRLGYTVVCAHNGLEAVEFASEDIQLIILDMIMPVMDGLTALRAIREKTPAVKVLIASGYTTPENMPVLERIGIEGFVHKPFELGKLASIVRDVLDGVAV